jgi:hypothetical protein
MMYDGMLVEREAQGGPCNQPAKGRLELASDDAHALGTYEMKHTTGKDTCEVIDFIDV